MAEKVFHLSVTTAFKGKVELSGLDIVYNGPPRMVTPLPDSVSLFEEDYVYNLLDLSPFFEDDFLSAKSLQYGVHYNPMHDLIGVGINDGLRFGGGSTDSET